MYPAGLLDWLKFFYPLDAKHFTEYQGFFCHIAPVASSYLQKRKEELEKKSPHLHNGAFPDKLRLRVHSA